MQILGWDIPCHVQIKDLFVCKNRRPARSPLDVIISLSGQGKTGSRRAVRGKAVMPETKPKQKKIRTPRVKLNCKGQVRHLKFFVCCLLPPVELICSPAGVFRVLCADISSSIL